MIDLNHTLIIQLAIVLGLMAFLSQLAFKPVLRVLQARRDHITEADQKANELQGRAQQLMERHRETLAAAHAQGTMIREEIRKESLAQETEILQKTVEEANQIIRDIRNRISAETETARADLQSKAHTLSREIAQRVLGRGLP